ncbi:YihY/virulence factor BrkB family protein [Rhodoplanes sp. TEM]|uniref:YihY/virulence factor BrkB family protein n=1 Tax=Rhodoplanes tepidamans TaxID=200616 RepID=A0ABT5JAY3_RHOTP|nr:MULTISPECIES: YihY/virulence factor BrkB family protein [Rhodoplanes]MDC7786838.1 YihY/virulence factor BrkB family protein [Rhodoplanes tepidamans]MDC7984233.1 YihY/virulence factor BrkB family protein [Rhodoplanes sp. TEM]MDQ0355966.1 membrane protein [Rhodoplanes tepidamans]
MWLRLLRFPARIAADAFLAFSRDDGWAIASHIALSTLMSLFPFLIFITAVTGYFGTQDLADQAALLLLEAWPEEVSAPIASEIESVLTTSHGGLLTIGAALALYFSSSGVESLRIGLNRSYEVVETRSWWLLRLESIAYVVVGALGLIVLAFLIVLGPLIFARLVPWFPNLRQFEVSLTVARFGIASIVLVVALTLIHKWLPAGRRSLDEIAPGIAVTLAMWLITGVLFGRYLSEFAGTYVSMYAGLASAMIALVFLYWTATIFVYGAALNQAVIRCRNAAREKPSAAAPPRREP